LHLHQDIDLFELFRFLVEISGITAYNSGKNSDYQSSKQLIFYAIVPECLKNLQRVPVTLEFGARPVKPPCGKSGHQWAGLPHSP
jgi:hypothetical protein